MITVRHIAVFMSIMAVSATSAVLLSAVAYGQGTEPFFCSEPGMVRIYEARDADGKTVSFNADSLADFTGDFTQGHATVISTVTHPEDTSRFRSRIRMRFDRGEVIMDMAALMEEAMQHHCLRRMQRHTG